MMLGDLGIDDFLAVSVEPRQRSRFVGAHQSAIADDVRTEDCGEPTFFALQVFPEMEPLV